tara:strand:- start:20 stop:376 length:357 start_codon:yes stop_codon:yes gene_type:complete
VPADVERLREGVGNRLMVVPAVEVQPLRSMVLTVYVPAETGLMLLPVPPEGLHEKLPNWDALLTVIVPEVPWQKSTALNDGSGDLLILTFIRKSTSTEQRLMEATRVAEAEVPEKSFH